MKKKEEQLLEVIKEISEHLFSLREIPYWWKKDLDEKVSNLIIEYEKEDSK